MLDFKPPVLSAYEVLTPLLQEVAQTQFHDTASDTVDSFVKYWAETESLQYGTVLFSDLFHQRLRFVSDQFEYLLGYPAARFINQHQSELAALISPADALFAQHCAHLFWRDLHDLPTDLRPNATVDFVLRFRHARGHEVWVSYSSMPFLMDRQGNLLVTIDSMHDVSGVKSDQTRAYSFGVRTEDRGLQIIRSEFLPHEADFHTPLQPVAVVQTAATTRQPVAVAQPAATLQQRMVRLTQRQIELVRLLAEGYSSKEVATRLFISPHTVHAHRKKLLQTTGCRNTTELVRLCSAQGLF